MRIQAKHLYTIFFALVGVAMIVSIPFVCVPVEQGGQDGTLALGLLFGGLVAIAGAIVNWNLYDL